MMIEQDILGYKVVRVGESDSLAATNYRKLPEDGICKGCAWGLSGQHNQGAPMTLDPFTLFLSSQQSNFPRKPGNCAP